MSNDDQYYIFLGRIAALTHLFDDLSYEFHKIQKNVKNHDPIQKELQATVELSSDFSMELASFLDQFENVNA